MGVDSPSANLKRLLDAKAIRDANLGNGKKNRSSTEGAEKPYDKEDVNMMVIDDNEVRTRSVARTQDSESIRKERSRKEANDTAIEQHGPNIHGKSKDSKNANI